ncbi:hypothetical protein ACFL59_05405 [Planctomycetota bacterium]
MRIIQAAMCLVAVSALSLLLPTSAAAQAQAWNLQDCQEVPLPELASNAGHDNKRVYVDVKVVDVSGFLLIVRDVDLPFVLLAEIRDRAGSLQRGHNLRCFGWVAPDQNGQRSFFVKRMEALKADPERFQTLRDKIAATGDADALLALAERIRAERVNDPSLEDLARSTFLEGLDLKRSSFSEGKIDEVLIFVDMLAQRYRLRKEALKLLVEYTPVDGPMPPAAGRRLRELNAIRHGRNRQWMLFDEVKRLRLARGRVGPPRA